MLSVCFRTHTTISLYDLVEDLLDELKIRRPQQVTSLVDRHDPQTIEDLMIVVALLITPASAIDSGA
jgi:hypothetical protein